MLNELRQHDNKREACLTLLKSKPEVDGAELQAVGKQGYRQRISDLRNRGHVITWVRSLPNGLGVFRYDGLQTVADMRQEGKAANGWMVSPRFSMKYVGVAG